MVPQDTIYIRQAALGDLHHVDTIRNMVLRAFRVADGNIIHVLVL